MTNNHKENFGKQTDTLFITTHSDDSVYFAIIFNIDIYESKQSTTSISSVNEWNHETFSVIGAVVIDIYQRTQTAKTLFDDFFQWLLSRGIW